MYVMLNLCLLFDRLSISYFNEHVFFSDVKESTVCVSTVYISVLAKIIRMLGSDQCVSENCVWHMELPSVSDPHQMGSTLDYAVLSYIYFTLARSSKDHCHIKAS